MPCVLCGRSVGRTGRAAARPYLGGWDSTPHPGPLLVRGGEGENCGDVWPRAALVLRRVPWAIFFRAFGPFGLSLVASAATAAIRGILDSSPRRVHDRILQTCQWNGFQEWLRLRCFVSFVSFFASFHPNGAGSGIEQKQTKETKKAPSLTECAELGRRTRICVAWIQRMQNPSKTHCLKVFVLRPPALSSFEEEGEKICGDDCPRATILFRAFGPFGLSLVTSAATAAIRGRAKVEFGPERKRLWPGELKRFSGVAKVGQLLSYPVWDNGAR